jgi:homoserine kinase
MVAISIVSFTISVPASSANIGSGLDCFGVALSLRLILKCQLNKTGGSGAIKLSDSGQTLPKDIPLTEENHIIKAANSVAKQYGKDLLAPNQTLYIDIHSKIPIKKGLGSSAAATVAGIALASKLLGLNLRKETIFTLGLKLEGHPDNIAAAVFGKFNIVARNLQDANAPKLVKVDWPAGLELMVWVSSQELSTDFARKALPDTYSRETAVLLWFKFMRR